MFIPAILILIFLFLGMNIDNENERLREEIEDLENSHKSVFDDDDNGFDF